MKRRGQGENVRVGVEKNPVPALMVWVERAASQNKVCGGKP